MPSLINCVCTRPLGANECKTQTGIADVYYTPYQNITTIAFVASACCPESEIASFGMVDATVDGLLQPITFVKQDDDTGALFEGEDVVDSGNVTRSYSFVAQTNSSNPEEECTLDSMLNQEVAFLYLGKDGKWKFINWSGGLKVTSIAFSTNLSYKTITLSGRANDRALYVSFTDAKAWADINLVPVSVDPINGLINA